MHNKGLLYSMDEKITPGQLKKLKELPNLDYNKYQEYLNKKKINRVLDGEINYHFKLGLIKPKPYIIYFKGNISLLDKKILGIVGPRNSSTYGQKVLEKLFGYLDGHDICTISGMAPGIDTICHELSIKHQIPTIAVLGGGMMHYQKSTNRYMMDSIIDNGGLILSEFKIDFEPTNYSFPQRNRIIAGLCDILFLPQAGTKSGSLITADFAVKMGKKVYGTPNGIFDDVSAGLNQYINQSKILAVNDLSKFVKENLGNKKNPDTKSEIQEIILDENEKRILSIINTLSQVDTDTLLSKSKLDFGQLMISISTLEMHGLIYQDSPGIFKKI